MKELKVEKRGKYGGVKIHLDKEDCLLLITKGDDLNTYSVQLKSLALRMASSVKRLLQEEPNLLEDRTDEEIAAILAKDGEKARLALERMKQGKDWKKIDPRKLETAMLKHVGG